MSGIGTAFFRTKGRAYGASQFELCVLYRDIRIKPKDHTSNINHSSNSELNRRIIAERIQTAQDCELPVLKHG